MRLLRPSVALITGFVLILWSRSLVADVLTPTQINENPAKYYNKQVKVSGVIRDIRKADSEFTNWDFQFTVDDEEGSSIEVWSKKRPTKLVPDELATVTGRFVHHASGDGLEMSSMVPWWLVAAIAALVVVAGVLTYLLVKGSGSETVTGTEVVPPPTVQCRNPDCRKQIGAADSHCMHCGADQRAIVTSSTVGEAAGTKIDEPSHTVLEEPIAQLLIRSGEMKGRTVGVPGRGIVLGRGTDCGIVFTADNISKHHARIEDAGGKVLLKDLESTNGTYVNGQKVQEIELHTGDEIRIGDSVLQFTAVSTVATGRSDGDLRG